MKTKITCHLALMLVTAVIGMLILEYFGWKIIEKMTDESHFPGFLSGEVLSSVLVNSFGALLIGILFTLIALVFPGFRRDWKNIVHIPLWAGISTFLIILAYQVITGLYSV
jgi:UPF0716 family protein affecting phage T7 exclusion